jgi:cytochrome c biogenesis protein CcdA
MFALLGVVLSIGLADSINPSTVGPALYLAAGRDAGRRLFGFIAGVFAVSATAGIVIVLGPGRALLAHRPNQRTEHVVEVGAGAALVVVAVALWLARNRFAGRIVRSGRTFQRTSFLAGAGIMAVELPTALPYFAVIAAITGSGRPATTQVALILLFNLMFVMPLLAALVIRQLAGRRAVGALASTRERLEQHAHILAPALVLLIALILLAIGIVGLS